MTKHSPKHCPKCGRFAGCKTHTYDRFGYPYTWEFYCSKCKLNFIWFAELEAVRMPDE